MFYKIAFVHTAFSELIFYYYFLMAILYVAIRTELGI